MGQAKDAQLEKLLLLGESEAVVVVAGAPANRRYHPARLVGDANRRHRPAHAEREAVARGQWARCWRRFWSSTCRSKTDPLTNITTVRLVLQPGLIGDDLRRRIWTRGTQRNAYHLGFLEAVPDDLPAPVPARADYETVRAVLTPFTDNPVAVLLVKLLDSPGQTFLAVSETQLRHPLDKYTTARLFDAIGNYFASARLTEAATHLHNQRWRVPRQRLSKTRGDGSCHAGPAAFRREVVARVTRP